ncbi:MAG: hypothetical protein WC061_09060, partial [Melioribacteraceae bacterium]
NFLRHVSGKQYQVWMFASADAAKSHLMKFLSEFPSEFGYSGLLMGLIGIMPSFRKYRIIFYALTGSFLFSVFHSINYDIADLDSYFLPAYIMFSFFIVSGFYTTAEFLNHKYNPRVSLISILLLSAFPPAINFGRVDQSNVYTYQDYSKAILNSTEKNSIIFSYQWDFFVSPSYYFQKVENFRNDVAVVDKELLRRSWYYDQIRRNHPDLFRNMESDIVHFLTALTPFERGENFEADAIEKYYRVLMTKLVSSNIGERNFYIGQELFQNEMQRGEFSLPEGYSLVPHLLLFKVVKGDDYVPVSNPDFTIRFPSGRNKYLDSIETFIYNMLIYRAYYELQFNKPDRAKLFVEKIAKEFPAKIIPAEILSRIEK